MINLIKSELFKMRKMKGIRVLFAAAWVSATGLVVLTYLENHGAVGSGIMDLIFMLGEMQMMTLLGGFLAAMLLCGDFENKTIQAQIACGNSRKRIIGSRMISYAVGIAGLLLPYMVVTLMVYAAGIEFHGPTAASVFLDMLVSQSGTGRTAGVLLHMTGLMIFQLLVYIAQLSLCVPVAFVVKRPVPTIAAAYVLSLGSGLLLSWEHSVEAVEKLLAYTPYKYVYGTVSLSMGTDVQTRGVVVSVMTILIMLGTAWYCFRRAEVK